MTSHSVLVINPAIRECSNIHFSSLISNLLENFVDNILDVFEGQLALVSVLIREEPCPNRLQHLRHPRPLRLLDPVKETHCHKEGEELPLDLATGGVHQGGADQERLGPGAASDRLVQVLMTLRPVSQLEYVTRLLRLNNKCNEDTFL